jgi:hypothetical protein
MPFTPTHVLAILPIDAIRIGGRRLPFSALVVGSMIPDFPLFVPLSPDYGTTHSVAGLFLACLPLGLACFLVFQRLMKRPLLALLPQGVQSRCAALARLRFELTGRSLAAASAAIVIGAATHVFWDSFTHRGRWGTRQFPGLNDVAVTIAGQAMPGYKVLQYGSTVVGLPGLALGLWAWLSRRPPAPVPEPDSQGAGPGVPTAVKYSVYAIAVAVPTLAAAAAWHRQGASRYARLGRSITSAGLALLVTTLVYCVLHAWIESRLARAREGEDGVALGPPDGENAGFLEEADTQP